MDAPRRVFALSPHASYACRHSGTCCTAGWAIPVEPSRRSTLGADLLLPDADGTCRFYDRHGRRCDVHRSHGEAALPSSCYQFPRRALIDDRGVIVSLSHFCPTAAELLITDPGPLKTVEAPPAFPGAREYEGLDARGAWPPLVKADLLFDFPAFSRWERLLVTWLGESDGPITPVLQRIAATAEHLRAWTPDVGPLEAWLNAAADAPTSTADLSRTWHRYREFADLQAYERLLSAIPDGLSVPLLTDGTRARWRATDGADLVPARLARRYVAAKAFGSWVAYEARGVRTMVAELVLADLVLRVEATHAGAGGRDPLDTHALVDAVRAADWLLVHAVERGDLIRWLGRAEHG